METLPTIVIAEDHLMVRDAVVKLLQRFGFVIVGEATTGIELLKILEVRVPDIVLLDLAMPEMDGNSAFQIISKRYPESKIVIFSIYAEDGLIVNYMHRGAAGFLPKKYILPDGSTLIQSLVDIHCGKKIFMGRENLAYKYSSSEIQLISYLIEGETTKQIAGRIGISEKGVEKKRKKIYRKVSVKNFQNFVKYSIRMGLEYLSAESLRPTRRDIRPEQNNP